MKCMEGLFGINSWTLFWVVLCIYVVSIITGIIVCKAGFLNFTKIMTWSKRLACLYSPIMPLRNYYRGLRNRILLKKMFWLLTILIFLNNFIFAMLYSKILLGIVPFLPLILLSLTGLGQGTLFARQPAAALSPVLYLEFGGYVFATTMGTALGISIVESLVLWKPIHFGLFLTSCKICIPWASALLLAGAVVESLFLRMMPITPGTTAEELQNKYDTYFKKHT